MSEVFIEHDLDKLTRAIATLPDMVRQRVMKQVTDMAEREALRRYRRTVSTWSHQPHFSAIRQVTSTSLSVLIGTDEPIYAYVDKGTKPHIIKPKGPGYPLRFQAGYRAKTSPHVLASGPGGKYGPEVRAMAVRHPGTKARGFSQMIFEEMGPLVVQKTLELIRTEIARHLRVWSR